MLPSTLDPRPSTLDPQPSTLDPRPSTLDPRPSTLDPRPSTLDPNSTEHATLDVIDTIQNNFDRRLFTCGIFIDLKNAFDTVDHEI